ncbi:Bug family tripartite tricarboxylate transporter substrate binding protein [Microvirga pudoricolor]|uniref:Bug family tripartite tricarboxylate transporter substrate binding protein n=1 Tax=Microvirga pudoricolor TaxID=2778729 RepID=UPI0019506F2B|nr:tripartite tricarboxylate transporter substrate binding protein [Microvirga pudoricolor]MBM6595549.1 tripartite tricarboxylate transporter substrate binding protein [Microvirga pudoricolor]
MSRSLSVAKGVLAAIALFASSTFTVAKDYPTKPIKILVPYTAGGMSDILTRVIAESLKQQLGQPVLVENKPGAATTLAAASLVSAPADGYTIMLGSSSSTAISPLLMKNLNYTPSDLVPVAMIGKVPYVLVASKNFAPNTVKELIDYAKAHPGEVNFATHGKGAAAHLTGEVFRMKTGIDIRPVHYPGSAQGTLDMIGGRVQLMFDGAATGLANSKSGQIKAISMGSDKRVPSAPELPTWKEDGVDFSAYTWYALFVKKGTPQDVIEKLHNAVMVALKSPAYVERMKAGEGEVGTLTLDEIPPFVAQDAAVWTDAVKALNLEAQ